MISFCFSICFSSFFSVYYDPFLVAAAQQAAQAQAQAQAAANTIQAAQVDPNYRLQVSVCQSLQHMYSVYLRIFHMIIFIISIELFVK